MTAQPLPETEHTVDVDADGAVGIQHPLSEHLDDGSPFDCPIKSYMDGIRAGGRRFPPGRYRVTLDADDDIWTFSPINEDDTDA